MDISRSREKLNTFLGYVLGRNPYEFGLVPDENGFVKLNDLLKAVREEEGFRNVTASSINELLITVKSPRIECLEGLVRASDRENLYRPSCDLATPKLLYIAVRSRAHGHVISKGIQPYDGQPYVILSSDKDMAERIGKRRDSNPVIITVLTSQAEDMGTLFLHGGESIFLARNLPPQCLSGPPLSHQEEDRTKSRKPKSSEKRARPTPGSFFLDLSDDQPGLKNNKTSKHDKMSWKHNKKKIRKQKDKLRSDY